MKLADTGLQGRPDSAKHNGQANTPKVSILIVSYNQKDFVAEAIESSVNQDYDNIEVVISDDGSTDGTAEIIAQLQARYPKRLVALLDKQNVGVTRNLNRALRACTGEFIAFMGGDDAMLPGKVSAQIEWFTQDQRRVLCGHAIEHILADGSRMPNVPTSVHRAGFGPEDVIRRGSPLPAQSIMVRASSVPQGGFDETIPIASELLFWIETLSSGGEYGYVEGVYAKYRTHDTNISFRYLEVIADVERTYRIVANRYPRYRAICIDAIVRHVIYFSGVRHLQLGDKRSARRAFFRAIREKPLYFKAWLRLLQTL